jgi:hypothetical protein
MAKNARSHSSRQVQQIAASISELAGWCRSLSTRTTWCSPLLGVLWEVAANGPRSYSAKPQWLRSATHAGCRCGSHPCQGAPAHLVRSRRHRALRLLGNVTRATNKTGISGDAKLLSIVELKLEETTAFYARFEAKDDV